MNCKPNDLAVVVRSILPHEAWTIGIVVRVLTTFETLGVVYWHVKDPITMPDGSVGDACRDDILQPIRGLPVTEKQVDEVAA